MHVYERIHEKKDYEDGIVLKACDAVEAIFQLHKSWEYRQLSTGGIAVSVILALAPKFMLDNPEMFRIPEGMDTKEIEKRFLCESPESNADFMMALLHQLGQANFQNEKVLFSFLRTAEEKEYAKFMAHAYSYMTGQDFNVIRHPYLLYEAVMEILPDMIRYEGKSSAEQYTEFGIDNLMAELADIKDGDKLYDGACGFGVLMSVALAETRAQAYMQDCYFYPAAVARMLMLMIGRPDAEVSVADTLVSPSISGNYGPFDKFLTHPPFGFRTTNSDKFLEMTQYSDRLFNTDVRNDQWLFIRQALNLLNDRGSGVALMNVAALNRDGRQYRDTRAEMIMRGYIRAVIELPVGVIGGSNTKWSIVLFDKAQRHDEIYLLDLSRKNVYLNFNRNGGRLEIDEEGIGDIAACVHDRTIIEGMSGVFSTKEIADHDYRLSVGTYIQDKSKQEEFLAESVKLWEKREVLKSAYEAADKELEDLISQYNAYKNTMEGSGDAAEMEDDE